MKKLQIVAKQMVENGKGILAADESTPTCTKRFESLGIISTEESRNEYRSLLFTAPSIEKYISGVILFDETFNQNINGSNTKIPIYLKSKNILVGIKVDTGAKILSKINQEKITEGLDGLRDRLYSYAKQGADFAKWRAVIEIGNDTPSDLCLYANAHALARYAFLCQENGLVPIVEPEVLMEGKHTIEQCAAITEKALQILFQELEKFNIDLSSIILKPNMVLPGNKSNQNTTNEKIAEMTYSILKENVPKSVPGIAFLSGGQSSDSAAKRLNTLNKKYMSKPWNLTFSYGRALQEDALINFSLGKRKEVQQALIKRAEMNHLAAIGKI